MLYAKELNCLLNSSICFLINIDGLPTYKSSSYQLRPGLGIFKGSACEKPFTIGIYGGNKKPACIREFLNDFISEIKVLEKEDILIENNFIQVTISNFVCDAPARAFLKCIKMHLGYNSCQRCIQKSELVDGKVILPEVSSPLSTDASFDEKHDHAHRHAVSPLKEPKIGMVSRFNLDYMHLVCVGVMWRTVTQDNQKTAKIRQNLT
ncbi:uncharacterized protein LOC136092022 [Hydra vulgaris]|uniref:Uncharacterized protein LOC136092022 n=1 Tax=Hydra vulgaris TaxID=6087 RepID=A0ABM4DMP7_HYDVU